MPTKTICSNCGRDLAPRETLDDPDRAYGICPKCEEHFNRQLDQDLVRFLETLPHPTLLVNQELRVVAYNENCLRNFCNGTPKPKGLRGGEFMGCQNAFLPQRCGETAACLDCAIRRAAVQTLKTGKPQRNTRAHLTRREGDRKVRLELLVSTDKLGDLVQITVNSFFTILEPPSAA